MWVGGWGTEVVMPVFNIPCPVCKKPMVVAILYMILVVREGGDKEVLYRGEWYCPNCDEGYHGDYNLNTGEYACYPN